MSKQSVNMSQYLPSYLKLDLNVGMADEHPFISSLNEAMQRICATAQAEAFSMTRSHFPLERKTASLEGYGFDLTTLNADQIERLYASVDSLFRFQGSQSNVIELAAVYFGDGTASVRRGRPLERKTMSQKISFPIVVADRDGVDRSLFLSLSRSFPELAKSTFIRTLRVLVPHGFEVIFQEPSTSARPGDIRFNVTEPSRLTTWRL